MLLAIIAILFWVHDNFMRMESRIEPFVKRNISQSHFVLEGDSCYYLFDTGFSSSAFYVDDPERMVGDLFPVMITFGRSVTGHVHTHFMYFSDSLNLDFIRSGRTVFNHYPLEWNFIGKVIPEDLPQKPLFVIGMNLIRQANWLFDMKNKLIHCLPKQQACQDLSELPDKPVFVLPYRLDFRGKHIPRTDLDIDGTVIPDLKIDTGCDISFNLRNEDIERLGLSEPEIKENKVIMASGRKTAQIKRYEKEVIRLNNQFDLAPASVYSTSTSSSRLLGKGFFQRFDYVFLDTDAQKFFFYLTDTNQEELSKR